MPNQRAPGKVLIGVWLDEKMAYLIDEKYGEGNRSKVLLEAVLERLKRDKVNVEGLPVPHNPKRHRRIYPDHVTQNLELNERLNSSGDQKHRALAKKVSQATAPQPKARSKKPTVATSDETP